VERLVAVDETGRLVEVRDAVEEAVEPHELEVVPGAVRRVVDANRSSSSRGFSRDADRGSQEASGD
jgi:hypothetical protein